MVFVKLLCEHVIPDTTEWLDNAHSQYDALVDRALGGVDQKAQSSNSFVTDEALALGAQAAEVLIRQEMKQYEEEHSVIDVNEAAEIDKVAKTIAGTSNPKSTSSTDSSGNTAEQNSLLDSPKATQHKDAYGTVQ